MKTTTTRMLTRIKSIYMYINQKGIVTTQDLVDEFGITPRTIQRDLNVLQFNELVYSPSRGKWTTTGKRVRLSS
ncbi:MAG: DeoR family transcriptional regulator [Ectobacillus sp.]